MSELMIGFVHEGVMADGGGIRGVCLSLDFFLGLG